ncbi:unnamed protein product, partial [marine sediment metagenome]
GRLSAIPAGWLFYAPNDKASLLELATLFENTKSRTKTGSRQQAAGKRHSGQTAGAGVSPVSDA